MILIVWAILMNLQLTPLHFDYPSYYLEMMILFYQYLWIEMTSLLPTHDSSILLLTVVLLERELFRLNELIILLDNTLGVCDTLYSSHILFTFTVCCVNRLDWSELLDFKLFTRTRLPEGESTVDERLEERCKKDATSGLSKDTISFHYKTN